MIAPPSKASANGRYAQITGWGMSVPEKVLTNADLARVVDTTDERIVSRTGIKERHVAGELESTATLPSGRARRCCRSVASQIDRSSLRPPRRSMRSRRPACAGRGASVVLTSARCPASSMRSAAPRVRSGSADHVLSSAETLSASPIDGSQYARPVGDAGVVVVSHCTERCGVLATELGSSLGGELLIVPSGGAIAPRHESVSDGSHFIKMNGREVFRLPRRSCACHRGGARKAG